jgi:hypothetical protein
LFSAAAGVRTLVTLLAAPGLHSDPRLEVAARHLASGHGLALGSATAPVPTASVSPVAPALLAMAWRAVHGQAFALPALTILLGAAGALAAVRLATGLNGPTAGRAAGWAVALSPLLSAGGTLLEPATFALAMLLALGASAEWLRTPRRGRALFAGLLWGVCALSAPVGLLLPPVVLAWAWRPLGLTLPGRERATQSLLLALGLACAVVPWTIRNAVVLRAPVLVTTSAGPELWSGNNATVWNDPALRGGTIDVLRVEPYASRLSGLGEPERDRVARDQALSFLASRRPSEFAAVAAARLGRLWSLGARPDDAAAAAPGVELLLRGLAVAEGAWLLLAALGTLRTVSGPRRWFQSLPLAALLLLAAAGVAWAGGLGSRLGFEPLVAMLAGIGALHTRRALHLRRRGLRLVTGGARASRLQ